MRTTRVALAVLLASAWAAAQSTGGTVGINLIGNYDWTRQYAFADAMRQSRGWGSVSAPWDLAAPVDADGWPTADAAVIVLSNGVHIGGTYRLSFRGTARVAPVSSPLSVRNLVYDARSDSTNADGDTNHDHWAFRRIARRTREIAEVFRSVFGAAAMGTRVRPLLCGHHFATETVTQGLDFLQRTYGPASGLLYAIGCGQYDTPSRESSRRTDLTVEEIVAEWTANLDRARGWAQAYAGIARTYGVRFLAYEGGVCCVGSESVDAKAAANRDPRVQGLVSSLVGGFLSEGADSFCYFAAASPYDRTGMYGLTEDITILDTPKTRGIADVLARLRR